MSKTLSRITGRTLSLLGLLIIFIVSFHSPSAQADPDGIFTMFLPRITTTGSVSWIGPGGGHIVSLAIDPEDSMKVFAGTWGSGIYRSEDGGENWKLVNSGLDNLYIYSLAIDPESSSTVYAGTYGNGVYKTLDNGESWSITGPGLNQDAIVYTLAIDPSNADILYAGTRSPGSEPPWGGGVYRSMNGGGSWQEFNQGLDEGWVYDLVINPDLPSTLFAATHSMGVYKYKASVGNWFPVNNGITDLHTRTLAIDPLYPSIIYVGTWHGGCVFKTEDWGNSWSQANDGLFGIKIRSIDIDPIDPQVLYAATYYQGVYKSVNAGGDWNPAGLSDDFGYQVAVAGSTPSTLFVGTAGDGLFKSIDQSQTWERSNHGLHATKITGLLADPISHGVYYAIVHGGGVYKSIDLGRNWERINQGLVDTYLHVLAMSPVDPQILFVGTDNSGIYKSTDGGLTWTGSNAGLPIVAQALQGSPPVQHGLPGQNIIEAELWLGSKLAPVLHHSIPASTTNLAVRSIEIDPENHPVMYIGTLDHGVYKSEDGGENWSVSGLAGKSIFSFDIDPSDSSHIYAGVLGDDGSLMVSYDAGGSWYFSNSGLDGRNVYALGINPASSHEIFAGTNDGLFQSTNGGNQWNIIGHAGQKIYSIVIDSNSSDMIYLGTSDGFYYSLDGGSTWEKENTGLVNHNVQSLDLDKISSRIVLGTDGSGVFRWNDHLP